MEIERYNALLKIRGLFQKVQQISWQSNQLAKKYPIDHLTEEEQAKLLLLYFEMIPELKEVVSKLETEYEHEQQSNAQ